MMVMKNVMMATLIIQMHVLVLVRMQNVVTDIYGMV